MNKQYKTRLLAAFFTLFATGCSTPSTGKFTPPSTPYSLTPPSNETLALVSKAKGVQVYTCNKNKNNPSIFEWNIKTTEADLYNDVGIRIGRQYEGPTWEWGDGSKVTAQVKASENASNASNLPWQLLKATSHSGPGEMSRINSIQRVNTIGGQVLHVECKKERLGNEVRAPYTATYYFYVS